VEPNSSNNPYSLNLKDQSLFQIPELSDFGSNTPALTLTTADQKEPNFATPAT